MRLLTFKFLRESKTFRSSLSSLLNSALLAFSGVLICTAISYAAQVTLEWDANSEPDISGYNVYYGKSTRDYDVTLDVGNWTSVTIADLEESEAYYFAVTAYDLEDNESGHSKEVCINCASQGATNSSGGGGGGGCFIATAASGSRMADEVKVLRTFRDNVLLTSSVGKSFERLYYKVSPPVAAFIARHNTLYIGKTDACTQGSFMPYRFLSKASSYQHQLTISFRGNPDYAERK